MSMIGRTDSRDASRDAMSDEIRSKEELLQYFHRGSKPRERWRVGTEYEKVAVNARDGSAIPFSGPAGVETILKRLADRFGYEPEDEEGRVLALKEAAASITVEPGGQIELSGEQCENIHCAHREFKRHVDELLEVTQDQGVAILGLGISRSASGRNRAAAQGSLPHHVPLHGAQGPAGPAHDEADRRRPGQPRL